MALTKLISADDFRKLVGNVESERDKIAIKLLFSTGMPSRGVGRQIALVALMIAGWLWLPGEVWNWLSLNLKMLAQLNVRYTFKLAGRRPDKTET